MQLAAAGTGVPVSDGSTNRIPVGEPEDVYAAWALHARLVRRSLKRGFYQGWDLHPAQLPTRFLATYLFFRTDLDQVGARLRGTSAAPVAECLMSRPPPRHWPGSCSVGCAAGRSPPVRSRP